MGACYNYGNGVKNASRDKKSIIDQLRGLQKVLEDVGELLEDEEAKPNSRLPALIQLLSNSEGLDHCREELESLKAKLETNGGRRSHVTQALIWPLKERDFKKTLDRLAQFQQSLTLTMNVDQTYVSSVAFLSPNQPKSS